jgi:tetratricopeptide (TPR) repeat protein
MPHRHRPLWAGLLLLLVYPAASMRHLDAARGLFVIERLKGISTPHLVDPGWRFVPRLLGRVSIYPTEPVDIQVDLRGEEGATSREGARLDVAVRLTCTIDPDRVLELHRRHGARFQTGFLVDAVRRAARTELAKVPHDSVRAAGVEVARAVREELSATVGGVGLRITHLEIEPTAGPGAFEGIHRAAVPPLDREILLIGLDGSDWRILDPLLEDGRMPNLAGLVARGARAHLRTIRPILSPVIWTSIATGVKPGRHGIVDFVVTAGDDGTLMPVTGTMRRVPALWDLLGAQGIESSVVAWWATWPADPIRGRMVTDRIAYQLFRGMMAQDWRSDDPDTDRGKTHPADLIAELRPLIRSPAEVGDETIAAFLPGRRFPADPTPRQQELLDEFRTVIAAAETYHAMALHLFDMPGSRFKTVYYEGPDTASHLFMRYRSPRLDGVDASDAALFGQVVDRYYEHQDRYLGELLKLAGADATVILVSDHGFKSGRDRPPRSDPRIGRAGAADWHTPVGMLLLAGPDIRPGIDLGAASILDVAPTVLALYGLPVARDMDGQPLSRVLSDRFLRERPIAWIDTYGGSRRGREEPRDEITPEEENLLARLRNLGYVGDDGPTANNNRGLIALEEGDIDGAIAHFERALVAGELSGTTILANLAEAWRRQGDFDRARGFAERALSEDPRNKHAELILAKLEERAGRPEIAERHLRRAIDIDPGFSAAHTRLGALLEARGDDDAALRSYRTAIEIAPLSPDVYARIGDIHRRRGELDRAVEAYREALRCDARHPAATNNLGLCLQELGRLEEARGLYERGLAIQPENPVLRNSLGTLLAKRGETGEAIEQLERAVAADPEWPVALGNLALLLAGSERSIEAGPAFERWIEIEPDSASPRIGLGEWLLARENLETAQRHLEAAVRLAPDSARAHALLGEVYLGRGRVAEGVRALRRSLSIDPSQDDVRRRLEESAP